MMADEENYDERPLRFCDSCGQVDRAPRHVYATAEDEGKSDPDVATRALEENAGDAESVRAVIAALNDTAGIYKHFDCCAADGCPTGTCDDQLQDADGKQNEELARYLIDLGPKVPATQEA
jgi:hypothetical protein